MHGMTEKPLTRRVVTGIDEQGQSFFLADGPSESLFQTPGRPGYRNNNIWHTYGGPTLIEALDTISEHNGVMPPRGGTVLRVVDFPPEPKDREEALRRQRASFESIFPDAFHDNSNAKSAGMHTTDTIDYAIVLSGEIYAVMDREETLLRAGDILVQRGTAHAWENRSSDTTRVAVILIDGHRPATSDDHS
jgi:mannose-6-phosphate isomerase-like protein (cupin superfamily)